MAAAVEKLPTIDLAWTANGRLGAAVTRPIWSTASTRRARFQKPEPFERWTASEARRSCGPGDTALSVWTEDSEGDSSLF